MIPHLEWGVLAIVLVSYFVAGWPYNIFIFGGYVAGIAFAWITEANA